MEVRRRENDIRVPTVREEVSYVCITLVILTLTGWALFKLELLLAICPMPAASGQIMKIRLGWDR